MCRIRKCGSNTSEPPAQNFQAFFKKAELQALATQVDIHAPWGGVVPSLAMEAHAAAMDGTVAAALASAGVQPCDLDAVAVTVGPGLALCLQVRRLIPALAEELPRTTKFI